MYIHASVVGLELQCVCVLIIVSYLGFFNWLSGEDSDANASKMVDYRVISETCN